MFTLQANGRVYAFLKIYSRSGATQRVAVFSTRNYSPEWEEKIKKFDNVRNYHNFEDNLKTVSDCFQVVKYDYLAGAGRVWYYAGNSGEILFAIVNDCYNGDAAAEWHEEPGRYTTKLVLAANFTDYKVNTRTLNNERWETLETVLKKSQTW